MTGPGFVHLHVHSAYSLLEGALPLGRLLGLAAENDQPALGIADTANLFGALEFSEKAAGKGIQPLIGCELPVDFGTEDERGRERGFGKSGIVLMAMSGAGFSNLSRLVSHAYLEGEGGRAIAPLAWLENGDTDGLICLSGGPEGAIDPYFVNGQEGQALKRLEKLAQVFGDRFYVELQRHGKPGEAAVEAELIDFAYRRGVPIVATNEPFFPKREDFEAHDALLAIAGGTVIAQSERRKLSAEHFFKTRAEMVDLFGDLPEALDNSVEIARRVHFRPLTRDPILPTFAAAPGLTHEEAEQAEGEELARQAREGLKVRLANTALAPGRTVADYEERLEFEIKVIRDMKFPGYFLIVADFIKWAKAQGIPVGPGRGSGAGSVVAWSLTITDLDPLRYNLLFERFLNPERVSMPDFDIDFCQDRREEVIRYVQEKYGRDQVAQIITFGTLQARAALRDVGRVLQMPYGQVDRICKLVPANPANPVTIAEAVNNEPRLQAMRDEDETVAELLEIGKSLEGLYRHASTHAAGIVIGDRPLEELVPLYKDPRSDMPVTQYSLKWVEPAGLVKFDFLGLKTLTVIDKAVGMIRATHDKAFSIETIPLDDKKTYELYQRADTAGVFQVESMGMRRVLLDLKPDVFEDIIAIVALYRPGPMDNIPTFCNRKHGKEDTSVAHTLMEPILRETYGIIVYQEQVMQIAQELSGYSLGEADMLRRAMGKKIKAEMDAQKSRFVSGAVEKGIGKRLANEVFELLAKFANYGFNKSHAAAYALVSYQTAYLKAHYPHEFLAATMTLDMGNTDKLAEFKREADRLHIELMPPSVNESEISFSVKDEKVFYSLCAVKGVGRHVAEHMVAARGAAPFRDFADFATRIDPKVVNRRTLETLVNAGAFDCLEARREKVFAVIDAILGTAQRTQSNLTDGIVDMFATGTPQAIPLPDRVTAWPLAERLEREFSAIGFHLSGHPLDEYAELFERMRVQRWADFERAVKEGGVAAGRLAGTVAARMDRRTRRGAPMAIVTLSDPTGSYECLVFSEQIAQFGEHLELGKSVVLEVEADQRPDGIGLRLIGARELADAAERLGRRLTVFVGEPDCLAPIKAQLRPGGEGTVSLVVIRDRGAREFEIELPGHYRVTSELAGAIRASDGVIDARLQ
ncbi:MAG: DNA polymerase III subunit alpha [Alphaproteobacteria bacterium]|nr:DNA polymerase III subunit alpha [Alphaproteobacteria bacterium]